MKKRISRLMTVCLALVMALALFPLRAEAAGASLSGSASLRPGETVTVTFSVSGSDIVAIQGTLAYGTDALELRDASCLLGGGWTMDMNGNTLVLYDSSLSDPVSSASVFSFTFRVKDGVASGSSVSASFSGITVTYGVKNSEGAVDYVEDSAGSASWSATIAAPLSGNANLSALSCGDAELSPAFSPDVTSYFVTVPYSVTSLDLRYAAADSGASAWVSGNELTAGSNTVSVGVEAANGSTKYYNIYATRQQDPGYQASTDARLASLTPSGGQLSPAFSPDVTSYVIYVPYETEEFSLSGVARDGKALSVTEASAQLKPGDNRLTVVCTAEDGKTKTTYTIHVYRMPPYQGLLPTITEPGKKTPAPQPTPKPQPEPEPTVRQKLSAALSAGVTVPVLSRLTGPLPVWALGLTAAILLLLLAGLLGLLLGRRPGRRKTTPPPAQPPAPKEPDAPAERALPVQEAPEAVPDAPPVPADADPQEPPADDAAPGDVSLDDLLEDIKNM